MRTSGFAFLTALSFLSIGIAKAQSAAIDPALEYSRRLESTSRLAPVTHGVFGEQISHFNGSTSFRVVDIDLPGDSGLPVQLARRFKIEDRFGSSYVGGMGEWDIDLPYISAVVTAQHGWTVAGSAPEARCSSGMPPRINTSISYTLSDIWHGHQLNIPGVTTGQMLANRTPSDRRPSDGRTYPWVAEGDIHFYCSPTALNGLPGESFVALLPNGTRYFFNWAVVEDERGTTWSSPPTTPALVLRKKVTLFASRIEDRFGNWVNFTYSGKRVTRISSNDGREISLSYTGNNATSASAAGRTWTYEYSPQGALNRVQLPDGSAWAYSSVGSLLLSPTAPRDLEMPEPGSVPCPDPGLRDGSYSLSATSPSGATGVFDFRLTRHYRSNIPEACLGFITGASHGFPIVAPWNEVFSIQQKEVSGPGITTSRWTYTWGQPDLFGGTGPGVKDSTVEQPDGSIVRERFGTDFSSNEGLLLEREIRDSGEALNLTTFSYFAPSEITGSQPFVLHWGEDYLQQDLTSGMHRPQRSTTVLQDGVTWTTTHETFDALARPTRTSQVRTPAIAGSSRVENRTFLDDTSRWVIGLPASTTVDGVAGVLSRTVYHPTSRLPIEEYGPAGNAAGQLQRTMTWTPGGQLASITDALGNTTTLSNHYRGVPRSIQFADGATISATVSDRGEILSVTDALGATTSYQYDLMGRMSRTDYPAGDVVAWHPLVSSFTRVATPEFGIPGGHWRQTITRGTYRKDVYFDALWRPVLEREQDTSNPATLRFNAKRMDIEGREVFSAYPVASASTWAGITQGVRTSYDALGRPTSRQQDSEHGVLTTTIAYLSGFRRMTTDARGLQTTESFWAQGGPSYDHPSLIERPEGQTTEIERNVLGANVRISRASPDRTIHRRWVYDANQRLCLATEPETGATVSEWDAAGNLAWEARGVPVALDLDGNPLAVACNRAMAAEALRVQRTYDVRNRVTRVHYPDGATPSERYEYDANGKLASATRALLVSRAVDVWEAPNVIRNEGTWSYQYNLRGMITREHIVRPGIGQYAFRWQHDAHGNLATYRDPWTEAGPSLGLTVDYQPNALGQPTRASDFATNVTYFPNGAIKSFTYGNGAVYAAVQNVRGMLDRAQVTRAGVAIVDDSYDYDAVGNVVALTDVVTPQGTRTMSYDGLDRLLSADYGNGTQEAFTYDVLDNIRSIQRDGQLRTLHYNSANQLSSVTQAGPGPVGNYGYNARGEQTTANAQQRTFDMAGRLVRVTGFAATPHAGPEVRYEYDVHGRRVTQWRDRHNLDVRVSYYTYDGLLRGEADNNWNAQESRDYVYLGPMLIAKSFASWTGLYPRSTAYLHTDVLGSTIAETNQAGAVTRRERHLSYGAPMDDVIDDTAGYTGHQQDPATGLIYMQQRYYHYDTGRFVSPDPIGPLEDPVLHFGRLHYANNSPMRYFDPDGRSGTTTCDGTVPTAKFCSNPERYSLPENATLGGNAGIFSIFGHMSEGSEPQATPEEVSEEAVKELLEGKTPVPGTAGDRGELQGNPEDAEGDWERISSTPGAEVVDDNNVRLPDGSNVNRHNSTRPYPGGPPANTPTIKVYRPGSRIPTTVRYPER